MVRQIVEDALVTCRHEVDSLLTIVFPAVVLGMVGVLVADTGFVAASIVLPLMLLGYLAAYAACVRAAGLVEGALGPDPLLAYRGVVASAVDLLRVSAPGLLIVAVTVASMLIVNEEAPLPLAAGVGFAGGLAFLVWASRHAFDVPLIVTDNLSYEQTIDAGRRLSEDQVAWTRSLLAALAAPLVVVALICWWLAAAVGPPMGAALFALAVALWLPLPAFCSSAACARWLYARTTQLGEMRLR